MRPQMIHRAAALSHITPNVRLRKQRYQVLLQVLTNVVAMPLHSGLHGQSISSYLSFDRNIQLGHEAASRPKPSRLHHPVPTSWLPRCTSCRGLCPLRTFQSVLFGTLSKMNTTAP